MIAFGEQVQVELAELRREEIGIVLAQLLPVGVLDEQMIRTQRRARLADELEQSPVVDVRQRGPRCARIAFPLEPYARSVGLQRALPRSACRCRPSAHGPSTERGVWWFPATS
jgi:hypothetical protein